ncbi:MAG: PRC-barrel domain-containing protein [Candidatus Micrarchaeia archaeon]
MVAISELYGKKLISTSGHWVGEVQHVILDVESGSVSHFLLHRIDTAKSEDVLKSIFKDSVKYERVKKISDTILVTDK